MAYGYKNLSKAQEDAIRIMKAHDNTLVKKRRILDVRKL